MSYKTCNTGKKQRPIFGHVFDDLFHEATNAFRHEFPKTNPSVNISEDENGFQVYVAAPGYSKEDFLVKVHDHILSISVKGEEKKEETENFKRKEFEYASFKRKFNLHESIDTDKVKAKYKNGILELTLPKKVKEEKEAHNIKVD